MKKEEQAMEARLAKVAATAPTIATVSMSTMTTVMLLQQRATVAKTWICQRTPLCRLRC